MDFEQLLGVKISSMIAGIMGGIVSLTFEEKLSFLRALLLIFTGGISAGYSYGFAEHYFHVTDPLSGFFGFCIGLTSMRLISVIIKIVDSAKKDPAILLSYTKLIQSIKNGDNRVFNGDVNNNLPDIHDAGSSSKEDTDTDPTIPS